MRHLAIHILKGVSALAINLKQQHSRMRGIKLAISLVAVCYIVIRLGKEPTELWHQLLKVDVLAGTLLAAALLLIPFNLGFEARKWQIMVRGYYPSLTFEEAFRAVLSGITVGIFTPNGVGAYAGRLLSLPSGHRTEAGARTFADRLCQMLVTLWMGLLAFEGFYQIAPKILIDLLGFGPPYLHGLRAYFVFLGICSILVVFNLHRITVVGVRLLPKSDFWNRIHYSLVHIRKKNLLQVVVLSIARFGIFSLQYLVLMYAFGYAGPLPSAMVMIGLIFFAKSLVPSVALTELGIRESIALTVMGLFDVSPITAFTSTFVLYILNLILPAIAGLIGVQKWK